MRVYYFTQAKWAKANLRHQRLKVSRFSELNDPFELLAVEQSNPGERKRMREWAAAVNQEEGVICFTTDWKDPLMWSHYGDRHRGVCLGFEACGLAPINYKPERLGAARSRNDRSLLLTTKFSRWMYENEYRALVHLKDVARQGELYFRPFDGQLALVEVIAGPRCCIGWRRPLAEAVSGLPGETKLTKARLSFKNFRVVTQKEAGSVSRGYEADFAWQQCSCPDPKPHGSMS